jgi:hypothetical protein
VNRARRAHLAALSRSGGSLLPWRPRAAADVSVLRVHRGAVYAGGGFATINGRHQGHLVALRPIGAGRVVASFHPNIQHWVWSVAFAKRRVVVAEGGPGGTLFVLGARGQKIWERTFDGDVQAVTVVGRRVYLGGHWENICSSDRVAATTGDCLDGGVFRPRLASYTVAGQLTAWSPKPDAHAVLAVARAKPRLAVGGDFNRFEGGAVAQPKFALFR